MIQILTGDCLAHLKSLPDESIHCCVTSPPYYGLRDYGIDAQIGLEETPDAYVARLVEVFAQVRRVLRADGTCWVNLGDSYNSGASGGLGGSTLSGGQENQRHSNRSAQRGTDPSLKHKDLIGIPWRVAFALQADGWVLRQEIIWHKPNPLPESVKDRCTKSHESIFLFAKAKWVGPEPRQYDHISDEDARWLALFLDTEGNICAKRAKASSGTDHFGTQISWASTNRGLLEVAQGIIGGGTIAERKGTNAPMFYLQLSNQKAAALLYRLYPFLIVKPSQAALGIHLQAIISTSGKERRTKEGMKRGRLRADEYTEELIRIWATMKDLNHFGTPDLSWLPLPKYGKWTSQPYHYDADAIAEPAISHGQVRGGGHKASTAGIHGGREDGQSLASFGQQVTAETRNKRSVWTITTKPFKAAHFATFPPELPELCIKAGCPKDGTVLDPFGGAGTTGLVADRLGRDAILIELNPDYAALAQERIKADAGLFAKVAV